MKRTLFRKPKITFLLLFASIFSLMSQETFDGPIGPPQAIDFCKESTIAFSQVIQCESSATFYAQIIVNPTSLGDIVVTYKIDGVEHTAIVENGELIIKDLPVGADITLVTANSCNVLYDLVTFNTDLSTTPKEQVLISQKMAHLLNPYGNSVEESPNPNGDESESLYDLVYNSEEVSKYEKIAFIQQFYYHFDPIPDEFCDEIPPVQQNQQGASTCICNWVISSFTSAFPTNLNNTTGGMNETFRSYTFDDGNGVDGGGWEGNAGPAHGRYHYLDSWKKDKGVFHEVTAGDLFTPGTTDSEYSSSYARIFYKLLCEGITVPPEDCDCEKTLHVGWHYNAFLSAKAKLLKNGGKKSSRARVDEMAVVMAEIQGEETQMLDHGSASARAACEVEINSALLTSAANIIAGAAMIAIGGWSALGDNGSVKTTTIPRPDGSTGTSTATNNGTTIVETTPNNSINLTTSNGPLISQGITTLLNGIVGTIGGFSEGLWVGSCENKAGTSTLVDGSKTFIIQANKGVEFTLSSFTSSAVGGQWKYQSSTYVSSEFFLGVKIPDNIQTVDSDCCSPAVGTYIASSWRDAIEIPDFNNYQYLTEVSEFFAQEPVWSQSNLNMNREWDNLVGPPPTVCDDNTSVYNGLQASPSINNIFAKANLAQINDGISISDVNIEESNVNKRIDYKVFDISGRLLNSGETEITGSELFISNFEMFGSSIGPSTALYFLHLNDGKEQRVLKFIY